MYEDYVRENPDGPGLILTKPTDPALYHHLGFGRLLEHHRHDVRTAFQLRGSAGLRVLDPVLFGRIADARTMFAACCHLQRRGGRAPGLNGRRLEDLDSSEVWQICRVLAKGIRDGAYCPGKTRKVQIPKVARPGEFRTLQIQNIEDRIVSRAVVQILLPITECFAAPFSFGFRPRRSRLNALATAVAMITGQGRWVAVKADMSKAFDQVPRGRLMQVLGNRFPEDILSLARLLVGGRGRRGIPQGAPTSPLYFNLYADQTVVTPWARRQPEDHLIRYADDLLALFRTREEAESGRALLDRLTRSAGLPLKPAEGDRVCNLHAGEELEWLGYILVREGDHLRIRIGNRSWLQLHYRLAEAHLRPAPPLRAIEVVRGWITQMGPCYPNTDIELAISHVTATTAELGFDELPSRQTLRQWWQLAYGRWTRLALRESGLLTCRMIATSARSADAAHV